MAVAFGRATTQNSTILPPKDALKLATGGKTLKAGDPADLIIVNLNHPRVAPVQDIDSALVLGTHGNDVQMVMVGGDILMRDGELTTIDEFALYAECRLAVQSLRRRIGIDKKLQVSKAVGLNPLIG